MNIKQKKIYYSLLNDILILKHLPNETLRERQLAKKYKTSRTTIRQILQKLATEGIIYIKPRSQTIVKKINIKKITESFLLRESLEKTLSLLILKNIKKKNLFYLADNIEKQKKTLKNYNTKKMHKYIFLDNDFHKYLFGIVNLKNFWDILYNYSFDLNRLRYLAVFERKRAVESTKEHLDIFIAIKKNNYKNLKKNIKKHLVSSKDNFYKMIKTNSNIIE